MPRAVRNSGFTLAEAMVSLSIAVMAGSVLLLGVEASLRSTNDAIEQTLALGLAQQLIDEALGTFYTAPGSPPDPLQYPLCANSYELQGNGRERFNDSDDFNGFVAQPAKDRWGVTLGQGDENGGLRHSAFRVPAKYFDKWRQEIEVYYVDPNDTSRRLPGSQTSYVRCIEVRIYHQDTDGTRREITKQRRVYAYVPPPG